MKGHYSRFFITGESSQHQCFSMLRVALICLMAFVAVGGDAAGLRVGTGVDPVVAAMEKQAATVSGPIVVGKGSVLAVVITAHFEWA